MHLNHLADALANAFGKTWARKHAGRHICANFNAYLEQLFIAQA
jgi:hypothetical protein